jgi:hypothetical protein
MPFKKYQTEYKGQKFIIEEDLPEIGWYLYIWNKSGKCIADYLQDNFKLVLEFAEEEFNIPKEQWKEIN